MTLQWEQPETPEQEKALGDLEALDREEFEYVAALEIREEADVE